MKRKLDELHSPGARNRSPENISPYHNEWTPICAANLFTNTRNNWRSYHRSWLEQGGIEQLNNCDSGAALNRLLVEFHENTKHGRQSIWTIVNSTLQLLGMGINARKGYSSWSALEKRSFHDIIMNLEGSDLDVVKVALGMRLRQVPGATEAISRLAHSPGIHETQKSPCTDSSVVSSESGDLYATKPAGAAYASYCQPHHNNHVHGSNGVSSSPEVGSGENLMKRVSRNLFCEPELGEVVQEINL
jgi:hypothetical protein